jgi:hypothetical protein
MIKSFFRKLYHVKFYFDITNSQTSWVTGKLPELVSLGVLLDFFGVNLTKTQVIIFTPIIFCFIVFLGWVLKKSEIYDIEQYVSADINPVQKELLEAARKVNRK